MTKPFGQDLHQLMQGVRANGKDGIVIPVPKVTANGTDGINLGESRFAPSTEPGLMARLWARLRRTT
ncbi:MULTISPECIES: hypothetical protein [Nocardioides]|uniref:hypothetical protein n=1 Tax=Nocardioides TaxID=1839 RepID=UPI000415CE15|nr:MULTISPECIES: hypothetical protein [Nocardioides]